MKKIIGILLFLATINASALTVFKSSTDGFWPESPEVVAISANGDIWFNKFLVKDGELLSRINELRKNKEIKSIIIMADEPLNQNSQLITDVVKSLEALGVYRVYFVK